MSSTFESRYFETEMAVRKFMKAWNDDDEEDDGRNEKLKKGFIAPLTKLFSILREGQDNGYPALDRLITPVEKLTMEVLDFAYGEVDSGPYSEEAFPSVAHGDESLLLKDGQDKVYLSQGIASAFLAFSTILGISAAETKKIVTDHTGSASIAPFAQTWRPDPKSNPCARFRKELPWSASNPAEATAVFQARCEISDFHTCDPAKLKLSSNGGVLALLDMGGWKNRVPYVTLVFPDPEDNSAPISQSAKFTTDFLSYPNDFLLDTERQLIIGGDDSRIKSYKLIAGSREKRGVHTMDTLDYDGPLALLSEGRLVRAGRKGLAVWTLDDLPTHGPNGGKIIGKRIEEFDTWRDDPEDIEGSTGVEPTYTIPFADPDPIYTSSPIKTWAEHPSDKGSMLCSTEKTSPSLYCRAIDLAAGARTKARYLGHGGSVDSFSTSPGDPNIFMTSCHDGRARLFDVRHPLPVLTLEPVTSEEILPDTVLGHPGGVPFAFAGGTKKECITVWDLRARSLVYDLSTGNNSVQGLAWDSDGNSLYAATECLYVDRHGNHHDYRYAKIPKKNRPLKTNDVEKEHDDDDEELSDREFDSEDSDFEEEDECVGWPTNAYHDENYYGHIFDSGEHRLYKYAFKTNADPQVLPAFGDAIVGEQDSYW